MRNDNPESSFQSPENYREYAKDACRALERYQKIRRPLMFHIFLVLVIFKPWVSFDWSHHITYWIFTGIDFDYSIPWMLWKLVLIAFDLLIILPLLGLINCIRHLEDGFLEEETDKPIFTLKMKFRFTGSAIKEVFIPPVDDYFKELKWEWFWRTWLFYPAVVTGLLGLINLFLGGFSFFMDLFFLKCWDDWLVGIEGSKTKTGFRKYLRGVRLRKLPQSAGSSA
ncbi:MAG: hypothetical protein H7A51_16025 [Akkermansiaceae bacterium]|nr:hypothetical protein [Akkermansiaceae bacterium]